MSFLNYFRVCFFLNLSLIFFNWWERERNIDLLFHLLMHSLVSSLMCPEQRSNPQPWHMQTNSNQLSYLARAVDVIFNEIFFYHKRVLNFWQMLFLHLLRWSYDFYYILLHFFSTFPPIVLWDSLFSTSSTKLVVSWFVYDGHSHRCEVVSHCGF